MDWGPSGRSIWLSRYLVLAERADHFLALWPASMRNDSGSTLRLPTPGVRPLRAPCTHRLRTRKRRPPADCRANALQRDREGLRSPFGIAFGSLRVAPRASSSPRCFRPSDRETHAVPLSRRFHFGASAVTGSRRCSGLCRALPGARRVSALCVRRCRATRRSPCRPGRPPRS
jgi:hypothetical protein